MARRDDKKLQVFVQRAGRVSRALWPSSIRSGVATNKAAQRRRSLILKYKWLAWFLDRVRGQRSKMLLPSPDTPVPPQTQLVRVWETFDLTKYDCEHITDAGTGGDTSELLLGWSEEQAAAYWAQTAAAHSVPVSSLPISLKDAKLSVERSDDSART
jgi:hypothetical protein